MPINLLPRDFAAQSLAPGTIAMTTDRSLQADVAYQGDPVRWMVERLHVPRHTLVWSDMPQYARHQWDGSRDPFVAIAEGIAAGQDVGVEAATGVGKTFFAGGLALWFLAAFPDALVITVAPKQDQLTTQLWKEIGAHWAAFKVRFPAAETVQLRVRMRPNDPDMDRWAILGYAVGVDAGSESAVRAQGFHAQHMLVIHEETPGIDKAVMTALANTCTGSHNVRLALGNPDHQLDTLHQFCSEPDVIHVRISAYDHPNVVCRGEIIPGAQSPRGIARLAARWGVGTAMFESRARGISPPQAADALIKRVWLEYAAKRWDETDARVLPAALGVDVAQSESGDKAAVALWRGHKLESVDAFPCNDATVLGMDVQALMALHKVNPEHVGVDPIGVGAATLNHLRRGPGGYDFPNCNGGGKPIARSERAIDGSSFDWAPDSNAFLNLRAQMWWQMREDLRMGRVAIPADDTLWREFTLVTYRVHNGKTQIESKEDLRKRLGRSPDSADSVVYGNWVRPRAVAVDDRKPAYDHNQDPGLIAALAADGLRIDGSPMREAEYPVIEGLSHGF